jgi:O-antigen/teichoic acid export membrane protein
LADQGVVSATNFLTGVIIARVCSKEELGLYMLGFSLILLTADLQTSLIATPYMVYAPRLKDDAHAMYTGSTLIHQLALCFLIVLALAGGEIATRHGVGPRGLGPVLWALVAVATLIMLRDYARRVFFACLKVRRALILDTCIAAGQIGGLLLLARFGLLSASRAYWVVGFACGIAVLGWLWSERSFYRLRISQSLADFKKNWAFGKWVFAGGLVWAISMNLYPWLLAVFHGTVSAGTWAACLGAVALGNPAVLGAQNFLGPKIAHVYAEEGARALRGFVLKASLAFALTMSLFGLGMMLVGGSLVALLYGDRYAGNGLVVTILAFNLAVSAVAFSFSRALYTVERADVELVVNLVGLFIMLSLGLWLVQSYGILGAALGLLAANTAATGVRVGAFLRLRARSSKGKVT